MWLTLQICAQDTVFFQKGGFKSCAEIHQEFPQTESGYYWVNIGNREAQVYCDMKSYGEYVLSYKFQVEGAISCVETCQ